MSASRVRVDQKAPNPRGGPCVILAKCEQKSELFCFVLVLMALPQMWLWLSQGAAART